MIDILHVFHAHMRFLIGVLALITVVKLIRNLMRHQDIDGTDAMLLRLYALIFTIQFGVGLVLLWTVGSQASWDMSLMQHQWEHVVTMFLALGLAHATAGIRRKRGPGSSKRALIFIAASLVLVIAGVARLKGMGYWIQL